MTNMVGFESKQQTGEIKQNNMLLVPYTNKKLYDVTRKTSKSNKLTTWL